MRDQTETCLDKPELFPFSDIASLRLCSHSQSHMFLSDMAEKVPDYAEL